VPMLTRAVATAAVCLVAAPVAGAANGRLVVDPGSPVVGLRTLIEVRTAGKAPLFAQVTSPTGIRMRVRLAHVRADLWRAAYHFTDDGQWTVRVARANAVAKVLVLQPGAALPPFRPNQGGAKAGSLSGLVAPGVVIGR
jgi:hypothetical protein